MGTPGAGVRVDRLVLTTDATCVPSGLGDQCTATPPPVTRSFAAGADARVEQSHPSTNYGKSTTLRADYGSGSREESYLSFPVSGLSGSVRSARLRVYLTSGSKDGPAVYGSGAGWKESGSGGITWRNRPAPTNPPTLVVTTG